MPAPDGEVREHVVQSLWEAINGAYSAETAAEIMWNATPAERQAVADIHFAAALAEYRKAEALHYVARRLKPWWWVIGMTDDRTMLDALKTCPRDVADEVLHVLYDAGWTEAEVGLPRPG
jgi:hypothetical protein